MANRGLNAPRCRPSGEYDADGRPLCMLHNEPMVRQDGGYRCRVRRGPKVFAERAADVLAIVTALDP